MAGKLHMDAAVFDGSRGCGHGVSTGANYFEFGQLIVDIIVKHINETISMYDILTNKFIDNTFIYFPYLISNPIHPFSFISPASPSLKVVQ